MNNNSNKLKISPLKLLLSYIDIFLFLAILTFKLVMCDKSISPEYFDYKLVIKPIIYSIICLIGISLIFKSKGRTRFLYIANIVISLILIADTVYFRYFKDVISVGVLRNGVMLGGVKSSVADLIKAKDFLYLADVFILIPLLILYKKCDRNQTPILKRLASFIIVFIIGIVLNGLSIYKMSVEQPRLITTMYNRVYIAKFLGDINFHILDIYNVASNKIMSLKKISPEKENKIKTYLTKNSSTSTTNMKSIGKGKNLIMIQVEALQQFVINAKVNGQEITPNLNRWLKKSLYFDNFFYQVASGNTSDAEFLTNNSLYPASSGAVYYMYAGNTYSSLAKEMNDKNYYTSVLHGYREGFWNRNVMYKAEKFDDFWGEKSYNLNETVGLGLSDKSFLNQSFTKMQKFKQPFYSFLITLSSHYPYDDVKGYGNDLNVGSLEGTLTGNYLKGIHYTDAQLGIFLDKLEKSGMLDNSILMLYGDHYAIPKDKINELYNFEGIKKPTDLDWFQLQKVPMLMHFPKDQYKGTNHSYTGQIDIYPTIANMFGLPEKYLLGHDLFNTKNETVMFRNGSFTDGNTFYISWTNTYYDIKTGKAVPETKKLKNLKDKTLLNLQYSDDILNHNLIKKFETEK
ncbi:LTA synthase family protein [Clostridium guangxiense]|uniref:LTA synthase family protein n=1 Tax=Clostridium guangxiense TaxID=1662055 RepID=UPI001E31E943|nr:LTA synthase family protein [Clostridium guangxiense]MCD2347395.1 LTA synthase family protein [Clostridium guangxiense]